MGAAPPEPKPEVGTKSVFLGDDAEERQQVREDLRRERKTRLDRLRALTEKVEKSISEITPASYHSSSSSSSS